jgi:hypothetical protein
MEEHHDIDQTAATNGSHGSMAPVLAGTEARVVEPVREQSLVPAPVVAAAGGALMGAAAFVLLRVLRRAEKRTVMRLKGRRRGGFEITSSRSFLVDVHMLKR